MSSLRFTARVCGLWAVGVGAAPLFAQVSSVGDEAAKLAGLTTWLRAHARSPEDYVLSKFKDHDLVLLGEWHRIQHDPLFVQALIRRLPEVGVFHLGIEFADEEQQAAADALVTAERYDEAAARRLLFLSEPTWGYREYLDLYRAAWETNQKRPTDQPRFRIVHLNYRQNWSEATTNMNDAGGYEAWKKVWHKGSSDEYMASVARREFIQRGHKALIYCGLHHAFTRYKQPETDERNTRAQRFMDRRTGNLLRAELGDRVCTIGLHAPWRLRSGGWAAPVRGWIDRVVAESGLTRVGFDVFETPFGELADSDVVYAVGYSDFLFGYFVDGWVWLAPFDRYAGCTVDEKFITTENLEEARNLLSPMEREPLRTVEDFVQEMRAAADFERVRREMRR